MITTKDRILDTAERLFAEKGIDAVSTRTVVEAAGVNVAAVHYHFGNREGMIREVIRRRVVPLNGERLRLLNEVEADARTRGEEPKLEDMLRAFAAPVFRLIESNPEAAMFLAHINTTPDDNLRFYFYSLFPELGLRFIGMILKVLPTLPWPVAWTRIEFMIGAMIHLVSRDQRRKTLAAQGHKEFPELKGDDLVDTWIAFCAAGLRAPHSGKEYPEGMPFALTLCQEVSQAMKGQGEIIGTTNDIKHATKNGKGRIRHSPLEEGKAL